MINYNIYSDYIFIQCALQPRRVFAIICLLHFIAVGYKNLLWNTMDYTYSYSKHTDTHTHIDWKHYACMCAYLCVCEKLLLSAQTDTHTHTTIQRQTDRETRRQSMYVRIFVCIFVCVYTCTGVYVYVHVYAACWKDKMLQIHGYNNSSSDSSSKKKKRVLGHTVRIRIHQIERHRAACWNNEAARTRLDSIRFASMCATTRLWALPCLALPCLARQSTPAWLGLACLVLWARMKTKMENVFGAKLGGGDDWDEGKRSRRRWMRVRGSGVYDKDIAHEDRMAAWLPDCLADSWCWWWLQRCADRSRSRSRSQSWRSSWSKRWCWCYCAAVLLLLLLRLKPRPGRAIQTGECESSKKRLLVKMPCCCCCCCEKSNTPRMYNVVLVAVVMCCCLPSPALSPPCFCTNSSSSSSHWDEWQLGAGVDDRKEAGAGELRAKREIQKYIFN